MLTRSRLGWLHINVHKFTTQLRPLVIVKISFLLNIFPEKEIMLHIKNFLCVLCAEHQVRSAYYHVLAHLKAEVELL